MRKLAFILIFLLWAFPVHAAAIAAFSPISGTFTSGTSYSGLKTSPYVFAGDMIFEQVSLSGGASAATGIGCTLNGVSMTQWGSTITSTKSVIAWFYKLNAVAADGNVAPVCSWTNANVGDVHIWHFRPSDGVALTVETNASTTASASNGLSLNSVTPSQSGDVVMNGCTLGGNPSTPLFNGTVAGFPTIRGATSVSGEFGWGASSGTPVMPFAAAGSGGPYDYACLAGAIKASGVGETVVGGADTFQSGSASTILVASPPNGNAGDGLVTFISERTPGVAITTPPVIGMYSKPTAHINPSPTTSCTVNVPPTQTGHMMIAHELACGTPTLTGWTLILNSGTCDVYYSRTSTGASEPSSYTATISGNNLFDCSISDMFDSSGGTLQIGANAYLGGSAATSFTSGQVTTLHNNALIWAEWQQGALSTITLPTTQTDTAMSPGNGYSVGWFNLHTAGLTATQTATSGTSSAWRSMQIEVYSTTAAALSGSSMWAAVPNPPVGTYPPVDPTSVAQLNAYMMPVASAAAIGQSLFKFASSEAASEGVMIDFGNADVTTPVDTTGVIADGGLAQSQAAPLSNPSTTDELVLLCTTYNANPTGTIQGQFPALVINGGHTNCYYTNLTAAVVALPVDNASINPYASIATGLKSSSTPARTSANGRANQQILEVFSTAPAPTPPTTGVPAYENFMSRNDPNWILATK